MIETKTAPNTERVTPLRPSEAMRLGRLLYPVQGRGVLAQGDCDGVRAVCALGALAAGYGWTPDLSSEADTEGWLLVESAMPSVEKRYPCPDSEECRLAGRTRSLAHVTFHLNDEHLWSTERIADWLEGLGL